MCLNFFVEIYSIIFSKILNRPATVGIFKKINFFNIQKSVKKYYFVMKVSFLNKSKLINKKFLLIYCDKNTIKK